MNKQAEEYWKNPVVRRLARLGRLKALQKYLESKRTAPTKVSNVGGAGK